MSVMDKTGWGLWQWLQSLQCCKEEQILVGSGVRDVKPVRTAVAVCCRERMGLRWTTR